MRACESVYIADHVRRDTKLVHGNHFGRVGRRARIVVYGTDIVKEIIFVKFDESAGGIHFSSDGCPLQYAVAEGRVLRLHLIPFGAPCLSNPSYF